MIETPHRCERWMPHWDTEGLVCVECGEPREESK